MVLAQADLYRRAGLSSSIARLLIDGLKRHYMRAAHSAAPPDDTVLAHALEDSGAISGHGSQFLKACLSTGIMPATPGGLLKLAQGCFSAQEKL